MSYVLITIAGKNFRSQLGCDVVSRQSLSDFVLSCISDAVTLDVSSFYELSIAVWQ